MSNRETFEYAIIRIVPKVERGEFMNIGVILFSKRKDYLGIKIHLDEERIRCLAKDVDMTQIRAYLEGWRNICEGDSTGGRIGELEIQERFRWLTAKKSTIIQTSQVHPGLTHDPGKKLDELLLKFVL